MTSGLFPFLQYSNFKYDFDIKSNMLFNFMIHISMRQIENLISNSLIFSEPIVKHISLLNDSVCFVKMDGCRITLTNTLCTILVLYTVNIGYPTRLEMLKNVQLFTYNIKKKKNQYSHSHQFTVVTNLVFVFVYVFVYVYVSILILSQVEFVLFLQVLRC